MEAAQIGVSRLDPPKERVLAFGRPRGAPHRPLRAAFAHPTKEKSTVEFDASLLVIMGIFWVSFLILRNFLFKPVLALLEDREAETAAARSGARRPRRARASTWSARATTP